VKRQARLQALLERFRCPAVPLSEAFAGGTPLAGMGLQGGMNWNSDTASGCSGIARVGQLDPAAFRAVRMAACCAHAPDHQHAYRYPCRSPARDAVAVGLL